MPQFTFVAKDRMGNTVQGSVEAPDTAFAANQIGQMGYSLVDLHPVAAAPPEPTTAFSPPNPDSSTVSDAGRTQEIPSGSRSANPGPSNRLPIPAASPIAQAQPSESDVLKVDAERRRKVEMDLARLGMKPDEIKRLIDANPNTTAATAGSAPVAHSSLPGIRPAAKKVGSRDKAAERAADLQSFAAQLQSTTAARRVQVIEAVTLDLPDFRESTIEERQKAEPLLREVYALRRRERYTEALAKCTEAIDLVPADAAALETLGDLLQGLARTNEALAAYKRATEADPKRVSAERKYGDLLMRQQQWIEPDTEEVPKNPIAAAVLSLLMPGAGQIHNGQKLKGAVLLACAALCMAVLVYLVRDKQAYLPSPSTSRERPASSTTATTREKRVSINWVAQAPMIACILFYGALGVGSAIDAAAVAQRNRQLGG